MLITKTNTVKKQSGVYFYTYIPTEISDKLGLKLGNEYIMWNTIGSRVEIIGFPLEEAKKIIFSQKSKEEIKKNIFIKKDRSSPLDLL